MTQTEARTIIAAHFRHLPRRLNARVQLADYEDEAALRFLKTEDPTLTLDGQRLLNTVAEEELVRRGAAVERVLVRLQDYFDWLVRFHLDNSPANRAQFIAWTTAPEPKPQPIPDKG